MKRLIPLTVACVLLVALTLTDGRARLVRLDPELSVTVYTARGTRQGDCATLLSSRGAYATTVALNTTPDALLRSLGLVERNRYTVDGVTVIEGYSALLGKGVTLDYGTVNAQIAVRSDGSVLLGLPLLVGSY